jgi:hypothetical protein
MAERTLEERLFDRLRALWCVQSFAVSQDEVRLAIETYGALKRRSAIAEVVEVETGKPAPACLLEQSAPLPETVKLELREELDPHDSNIRWRWRSNEKGPDWSDARLRAPMWLRMVPLGWEVTSERIDFFVDLRRNPRKDVRGPVDPNEVLP